MDKLPFWHRVDEILKTLKKTQQDLCAETGIIIGTFKGWRVNDRLPDTESSVKIAAALCTTVEYLITGMQTSEKEKSDKLVKDIQQLLTDFISS